MTPSHIEHIGIAVKDLEEAIPRFRALLGADCYAIEEISDQQVRTAFFHVGESKIELLQSTHPDGPVGKFVAKHGEGVHHIAFAVRDLDGALRRLETEGVRLIDRGGRAGAEGMRIAFLHPRSVHGVLTELCERP
jgi:methylmalonyl-CoA/ethylmalonyl-CoA epimerase